VKSGRFIGLGLIIYGAWYVLYQYLLIDSFVLDEALIHSLVCGGEWLLSALGEELTAGPSSGWRNRIGIIGSEGSLSIGAACDGLVLFALFAAFVLAFPGNWRRKIWFIPAGMALLHVANLSRVVALTWVHRYHPDALAFNHDYTFTVLVYGVVFYLWYLWVEKLSS